jgi:integrase
MGEIQKSAYGSVRPYTRHTLGCRYADDANYDKCKCPKWLYVYNARTGKKTRKSLVTPSWAEAVEIAFDTLKGMDPEVAEARAKKAEESAKSGEQMTVAAACDLWIDRTIREFGPQASAVEQYRWLKNKVCGWAASHGIVHVQDITTLQLERWYSSSDWHFAPNTKSQRWGILRSMFRYMEKRGVLVKSPAEAIDAVKPDLGHVQGPYTDEQVNKILVSVEKSVPANLPFHKRETYAPRLRTFINLLLETGADVGDALLHERDRIETHKVKSQKVHIYRYRRQKTDIEAIIPISARLVEELKNVPLEAGTYAEMPFRTRGLKMKRNQKRWSERIEAVLEGAGVEWVEVPRRNKNAEPIRNPANAKQFRHTFAVRQLVAGHSPEDVAKMLGHVDTEMIKKHYAPWVKALDDAFIGRVVGRRIPR